MEPSQRSTRRTTSVRPQGAPGFAVGVLNQSVNFGLQREQRDFENIFIGYDAANYQADDAQTLYLLSIC